MEKDRFPAMGRLRISTLGLAFTLFFIACIMTPGHGHGGFLEDGIEPMGWWWLVFGWNFGILSPVYFLVWLANPLWILSFVSVLRRKYGTGSIASATAAALSLVPLALFSETYFEVRIEPPIALIFHGGRMELRLGYFAWVSSHAALFVGASLLWFRAKREKPGIPNQSDKVNDMSEIFG
jgi:hypothetical protein